MKIILPILLALVSLLGVSCQKNNPAVDGISSATIPHDKIVLPPAHADYEVLGHIPGLNNYLVKYDSEFYRGGKVYDPALASEAFARQGIQTIVSITPTDEERAFCNASGIELIEVPFSKKGPTKEDLERYFDALTTCGKPVYVHCLGGSHRAGLLGAAYRIEVCGWEQDRALVEYGRLGGDLKEDHAMLGSLEHINR